MLLLRLLLRFFGCTMLLLMVRQLLRLDQYAMVLIVRMRDGLLRFLPPVRLPRVGRVATAAHPGHRLRHAPHLR
jgi:hypothetical protein